MTKTITGRSEPYRTTGSYEQFETRYQPICDTEGNPLKSWADIVEEPDIGKIWTIIEGYSGKWYIVAGLHFVNRTGYYILCENSIGPGFHRDYLYV